MKHKATNVVKILGICLLAFAIAVGRFYWNVGVIVYKGGRAIVREVAKHNDNVAALVVVNRKASK